MNTQQKILYGLLYLAVYVLLYWLFMTGIEWAFVVLAFIGSYYLLKGWGIDVDELFKRGEKRNLSQTILYSLIAFIVAIIIGFLVSIYA